MCSVSPDAAAAARQRAGRVVDLGVCRRRSGVVPHHRVDDAAGPAPAVGARHSRNCLVRVGQGVLVGGMGAALRAAQECSACLHHGGTAGQHTHHVAGTGDAASDDERHPGVAPHRRQQRVTRTVLVRPVVVGEAAAVRASLRALQAQTVGTDAQSQRRLFRRGHRHGDAGAGLLQRPDDFGVRAAEGETYDCGRLSEEELELGGVPVVVPYRRPHGRAEGGRLRFQGGNVLGERRTVRRRGPGHEDVDPEGRDTGGPHCFHLPGQ